MYFFLTGAIYLGGAGAVIVGGLYWKYGSTMGAWAGMITGGAVAFGGGILRYCWSSIYPTLIAWFPGSKFLTENADEFPYDGMRISFCASLCAIAAYIGLSLFARLVMRKPAFNMERMLHRGKYAIKGDHEKGVTLPVTGLKALLPGKEFSKLDKLLHISVTVWSLSWFVFFLGVTTYHLLWGTTDKWWLGFWSFKIWLTVILGIITTVWFLLGGVRDIRRLFYALQTARRNRFDDGRVVDHHNLADEAGNARTNTQQPDSSNEQQ